MEAGYDDMEREERRTMKIARQEDREQKELIRLDMQRERAARKDKQRSSKRPIHY